MNYDEFELYMLNAYKNCNFFNSRSEVEALVKKYGAENVTKFIRKNLELRKKNEKLLESKYESLKKQYLPRGDYLWEEALGWVTHKFKVGEYVFFYYSGIKCGKIARTTKKGYKIFIGREIGIEPDVSFKNIICHASNIVRLCEELKKINYDVKENW